VLTVRTGSAIGLSTAAALLAVLSATVGLGPVGWAVGAVAAVAVNAIVLVAFARQEVSSLGPADRVTLVRANLAAVVAALVADSIERSVSVPALVGLAALALVLDAVDGWMARRTGTASAHGARFDMEVDAFLIFALSIYVARLLGPWVLAIGAARYLFVLAGRVWPWLREPTPPRYWCKVVAAVQGIVLTVAASGLLPRPVIVLVVVAALALLTESFGNDVRWLWLRHRGRTAVDRSTIRSVVTASAFVLVWAALVAPNHLEQFTPSAFVRIPIEGLVVIAVGLVLPSRARQAFAVLVGLLVGMVAVLKILDLGFYNQLDRPFNPVSDWGSFGPAVGVVRDSVGRNWAIVAEVAAILIGVAIIVLVPLSMLRLARVTAGHRAGSARTIGGLGAVWAICAVSGLQIVTGAPIASTSAAGPAYDQVHAVRAAIKDEHRFSYALTAGDQFENQPGRDLLTGLRGKDVIVAFVESYGKVAVQDSAFSPAVDDVLKAGTRSLADAGFSSRSAFLTSPTFGGISWLAHSTLQSGLWISSQQRYDKLVEGNHFTLSRAFKKAGWRTVDDVPSNYKKWPTGTSFYGYDKIYDRRNVGYAGPSFSYASMPDQYVLSAFRQRELAPAHRRPVMAEIDLVSSHTPWAPLPHLVDWNAVGNGSIFDGMPEQGRDPQDVWQHASDVQAAYGQSIQYTLSALTSFVTTSRDKNLVLVVLGDHQPATIVSGTNASHDVPISVIAHDPKVMDRIASWGWQDGLLPGPTAPVWPMDSFRNRFLAAYGPREAPVSAHR
jgi:phosphatidylglycerophosphate synthase